MSPRRVNVLVYSGNGCTVDAVRHCVYSLRRLLSPNYAIITIEGQAVVKEPWTTTCALFVMPGGADLGYCRTLNGEGNRRISRYVESGGAYLGFCAGAYYASGRCEFEEGNKQLEVVGDRELAFFPGICRGLAFPGFVYHSEAGTRAVELQTNESAFGRGIVSETFRSYYNGGGVFVDAPALRDKNVHILAEYTQQLSVKSGEGSAAVVYCPIGKGGAILSCTHIEFAAINLDHDSPIPGYDKIISVLAGDDEKRTNFLKSCLIKLGLEVTQDNRSVPSLSRLHLSSASQSATKEVIDALQGIITSHDGDDFIKGQNDTFHLERPRTWSLSSLSHTLDEPESCETDAAKPESIRFPDYDTAIKRLLIHTDGLPAAKETPYFNHDAFFTNLKHYYASSDLPTGTVGRNLMYGEVVTSTSTMLEKNVDMLRRLPSGFTAAATVQVAGRGRGSNVWVSPAGSLMFSFVVRHAQALVAKAPIIFLQYIAALAILQGVRTYDVGFQCIPIKLKWPNDIYALDPTTKTYVKIGGIIVNSHYDSADFISVIGIGLNTSNSAPTSSLNALKPPIPFTPEKLLARILSTFSSIYKDFCENGFDQKMQDLYYQNWLHTDQVVTLDTEGGVRARIKGITADWGLLVAEELGWQDRPTGKVWQLQSDSNSFDFFKGLIKRKV